MHIFGSSDNRSSTCSKLLAILTICLPSAAFAAEGGGGITVIPDASVFIQIANFIILIFILNIVLYRPIRKILIERKNKIGNLEQGIETFQKDAVDKEEAFANGIKDARAKGLAQKDALLAEAAEEERQIIGEINERAQAEMADIKARVAKEADSVRQSLQSQMDDFASAIGQKILGRTI